MQITPKMVRYSHTRYAIYFASALLQALVLVLLLRSGISAKLRDLAERKARAPFWQACIYFPLLMGVYSLLLLPLSFYSSFL
ncbi:hypothetical protein NY593_01055, partial [Enterobacter asburiae]|uniref:hypothetical protein n=1 Tax=Enterobacter asburiae TaxID=61645 RepID=UPI0022F022FC